MDWHGRAAAQPPRARTIARHSGVVGCAGGVGRRRGPAVDAAAGRGGVLTTQTTLHREVLDFLAPPSTRGGRSPLADLSSSVLSEGRMVMDALTAAGAPSGKTIWSQGATPHPSMLPRACQPPSRPATYSPPPRRSSTRPTAMGCGSYDAAAAASTTVANLISFASCSERRGTSRMKRKNANEKL